MVCSYREFFTYPSKGANASKQKVMCFVPLYQGLVSVADVKMEIPVLVRSLKSSILSSISLQRDKTF